MTVRISRPLLQQILAYCADAPEQERCGLLLGDDPACIAAWLPAANVASDPTKRFEIDPASLISAHKAARTGGMALLGCFHSHPTGSVEPSPCDADLARDDGQLWLICAGQTHALWRAGAQGLHGRFTAERLEEVDEVALASPGTCRQ